MPCGPEEKNNTQPAAAGSIPPKTRLGTSRSEVHNVRAQLKPDGTR